MEKRGFFRKTPMEDIIRENMVWMPYYRIQFNYTRPERGLIQSGETGRGETALNAMFCGSVKSERELFMLFRPNYLKYKIVRHSPQPEEIVGPTSYTDFDGVLGGFVKRLNEVRDELHEFRSELHKSRVRTRRYSLIFPPMWELKRRERFLKKLESLVPQKIR